MEERLTYAKSAVLGTKIHPLQLTGAPVRVRERVDSRPAQNISVPYGDEIGGAAMPVDVEKSVVAGIEQLHAAGETKLSADFPDEVQNLMYVGLLQASNLKRICFRH